MTLETSTVQANEVVKAEDWDFGLTAQVKNIGVALASVLESRQSFVIGGKITPYAGGGLNLSIAPLFGVANSTLNNFLDTSKMEPIPVSPSPGEDRIDIVEAQGEWEEFDQQQRAFMDFETNVQTFQTIATKKRNKVNVRVKAGTPGSVMAPEVSEGWVKLAEIHIQADMVDITEDNIKNITADVAGLENTEWTNDKTATYNIGYISDVNQRFRTAHNADGTHKDKSINIKAMAIGTGTNELNGSIIPSGKAVNVSGQSIGATTSLADTISNVCQKVTDIWDKYLKNGNYQLNGEVAISDVVGDTGLTKAIKVGAAGDGTGYIKLADKVVLTFTGDSIRASADYVATNAADLITKSVTDALSVTVNKLAADFDDFKRNLNSTTYANTVLSRFTMGEQLYAATTGNITLSGLQTIDGVSLQAGVKILVKDQDNQVENGIYEVNANVWQRDSAYLLDDGIKYKLFEIGNGTTNKGKLLFTPLESFEVGTDNLFFEESIYSIKALPHKVPIRNESGRIDDFESFKKELLLAAHPVGSLYWSSKPTNPAELFGGTWTQIKDKFILAAGDTYSNGATGGNASTTLITENLPSHTHGLNNHTHSFTPSGSVQVTTNPTFTGTAVTSGGMSGNATGSFPYGINTWYASERLDGISGNVSANGRTTKNRASGYENGREVYIADINVAHTHTVTAKGTISGGAYSFSGTAGTTVGASGNTTSTGSGSSFSNMPPYIGKYCWERIA